MMIGIAHLLRNGLAATCMLVAMLALPLAQVHATEVVMHKSPNCGCCSAWADTLKQAGFTIVEKRHEDMDAVKQRFGVPWGLSSCHTAVVGGYLIEGHVPAADVLRLLKERPEGVAGLSAPGMPMQSPGMQQQGLPPRNYDVLAFDKDGHTTVFSHY